MTGDTDLCQTQSEAGSVGGFADLEELRSQDKLDFTTFEQILEMDDDEDDREFSLSIVSGFFEQAENTFEEMETALYVIIVATLTRFSDLD